MPPHRRCNFCERAAGALMKSHALMPAHPHRFELPPSSLRSVNNPQRNPATAPRAVTPRSNATSSWHVDVCGMTANSSSHRPARIAESRSAPVPNAPLLTLTQPSNVRAEGDAVTLTAARKQKMRIASRLTGAVTLTAHGESVTLHNPVTIFGTRGRADHRGHAARRELC